MISILIDNDLEKYSREIKYTFEFIFQTLGLCYRFMKQASMIDGKELQIIYRIKTPSDDELLDWARNKTTVFIPAEPDLYDPRAWTPDLLRRNLREIKLLSKTPVLAKAKFTQPAESYSDHDFSAGRINFDAIGNIFFHLAALEQQVDNHRDECGVFPDENSAFFPWKDTPFIDNILWLLDCSIKEYCKPQVKYFIQKPYWADNKALAITLTHTVDSLQKWTYSSIALSVVDDLMLFFTLNWKALCKNIVSKLRYIFTNYEMYWNFEEFRHIENSHKVRSTYFIAAEANSDIDYALDDSDLQAEIHHILREGNEIGLLATDDKLSRDDFITRKQIMLHQTGKAEIGLRQLHYRCDERIRDLQLKALPAYNSSMSFKEEPGFKNGFSIAYHPWISAIKASFLELPTVYRDAFLKVSKQRYLSIEDAKHQIKKVFQNTLRSRGVFGVDFTLASFTDVPYCEKLYKYLLALISANNAWVCTPLELVSWWNKRSRVTIEEGEEELSVFFPDDLESFSLQIWGDVKAIDEGNSLYSIDRNQIHFSNIKAGSIVVIKIDLNHMKDNAQ